MMIAMSPGDTLQLKDGRWFTVGEGINFHSYQEIEDFLANSEVVEWEATHYPPLFGIFGGVVSTERYRGLVRKRRDAARRDA